MVDGTGRVTAAGGLETHEGGHAVFGGKLTSKGPTVLERRRATRDLQGVVEVDASVGTFFEVPDDGVAGSANVLRIKVTAGSITRRSVMTCTFKYFASRDNRVALSVTY